MAGRNPPPDPERFLVCELDGLTRADLAVVDALACAALAARRQGYRLVLDGCPSDLEGLIRLCGLAGVLPDRAVTPPGAAAARTVGRAGRCRGRSSAR